MSSQSFSLKFPKINIIKFQISKSIIRSDRFVGGDETWEFVYCTFVLLINHFG